MPVKNDVSGFTPYCSPKDKKGQTILASVDVFEQCMDLEAPEALLVSVSPDDMAGGQGVSMQSQRQYTPINTASAVTEVANMYSGHPITFSFNIQKGAFNDVVDEIIEGDKYEESTDRPGWKELKMADRAGEYVSTYSVVITYRSGEEVLAQDFIPNCEILSNAQGGMVAGQTFNRTIELKAQPIGDVIGTRVKRYRKS
jgi:hypothetical protein